MLYIASKCVISKRGRGTFFATAIKFFAIPINRCDVLIGRKTKTINFINLMRSNEAKITQRQF